MRTHLQYLMTFTISQTCVCLMANLVLLKLNFILDSSFLCCAWLCCHTHAHYTCSMLLFHSATIIQLHHVINLHLCLPQTVSVDSLPTCTYSMIVYKDQGIDWHPQSDSLGVSSLKQTCSTHPIVSGLCRLVESLGQLIFFIGCFSLYYEIIYEKGVHRIHNGTMKITKSVENR